MTTLFFDRLGILGEVGGYRRSSNAITDAVNPRLQPFTYSQDVNVDGLKSLLRTNTTRKGRSVDDVLRVSLHLDRKHAYHVSNESKVGVFKHANVLGNYYLALWNISRGGHRGRHYKRKSGATCNISAALSGPDCDPSTSSRNHDVAQINVTQFLSHRKQYHSATKVLLYQHELGSYAMRDCFKVKSLQAGLHLLTTPVNQNYRQEWELFSKHKRNKYDAIFGGMAFGVCENLAKPCMYFTTVVHPIDRILQVYHYCQQSRKTSLCSFTKANSSATKDLYSFIKSSGNTYFKKLLYYSKHCKLLGDDQICIQDGKTSFLLSSVERRVLLNDVLHNLDKWFAVVGLGEHYKDSLRLFGHVTGLMFSKCTPFNHSAINQYLMHGNSSSATNGTHGHKQQKSIRAMREKLMQNPRITQWLYADLKIYERFQEIYAKQLEVYEYLKHQNLTGKKLSRVEIRHFNESATNNRRKSQSKANRSRMRVAHKQKQKKHPVRTRTQAFTAHA